MNQYLRYVMLSVLVLFSPVALCDANDHEGSGVMDVSVGQAVVNALISDPTIGQRLREDRLSVGRITRQIVQPGVTEYVLYVHTCAMCDPGRAKTGFVSITEDVRPTYMDGAIDYNVSFSIEDMHKPTSKNEDSRVNRL